MTSGPRRTVLAGGGALAAVAIGSSGSRAATSSNSITLLQTYVAGTGYHHAAEVAGKLRQGDPLALRRRPDNSYDTRSIEVRSEEDILLGYLPRIDNQAIARLMDAGVPTQAVVQSVRGGAARPQIRLSVSILLS